MKNKLQIIDVTIVSGYMGRFQTVIVALMVLAITAHALVTRGDARGHVTMTVAVPASEFGESVFEPFSRLIARRTSRSVVLTRGDWERPAEVYVMPAIEFMERREALGLRALFSVTAANRDQAVIVTRAGTTSIPTDAGEVLFGPLRSLNACWVQLRALARDRVPVPVSADSLVCVSSGGGDRVISAVLSGAVEYGACRSSDIARLERRGVISPDEIGVVLEAPTLPEFIVAARAEDVGYVVNSLGGLGAVFEAPSSSPRDRDLVELLTERGFGSFHPTSGSQIADLETLLEFRAARSPTQDRRM
jgi:hypothetical protein